jgi:beta-xylosidase
MFEVDVRTGEKLSEERVLWDGAGGIYPEGPHIYERDGYYYLMVSEGGTFEDHMITVARSKDLWGPYTPYEHNPILTARGTDEYVQFTGHCDLFEDLEGRYWGVCLGVRRDSADRYILGRESFLVSATWPKGGWPTFERAKLNPTLPNGEVLRRPEGTVAVKGDARLGYLYIRDPQLEKHKFSDGGKTITLEASQADLSNDGSEPVTFVGRRQQQLSGKSTVTMRKPSAPRAKLKAGLACYKDEHRYARIFYDFETSEVVFEMINVAKSMTKTVRLGYELDESLTLQLDYTESSYQFSFKGSQDTRWKTVAFVDTWNLSGHDFVGPVIGVFATAEKDGVHAQFDGLQVD